MGKGAEISRDEVKFSKFVGRLRARFSGLFSEILRVQLILKGVIRPDEWDEINAALRYDYNKDNYYAELKENEILAGRLAMLQQLDPFVGKYYSKKYTQETILRLTEEEIEEMEQDIETEREHDYSLADHQGTVAGVTQTAQQTYLQQNAPPEAQEMSASQSANTPTKEKK